MGVLNMKEQDKISEMLNSSPELQGKIQEILGENFLGEATEMQLTALANLLKTQGLDISPAEIRDYLNCQSEELSLDELEMVAGGKECEHRDLNYNSICDTCGTPVDCGLHAGEHTYGNGTPDDDYSKWL